MPGVHGQAVWEQEELEFRAPREAALKALFSRMQSGHQLFLRAGTTLLHPYLHACLHLCLHPCLHPRLPTRLHTCLHLCLYPCLSTLRTPRSSSPSVSAFIQLQINSTLLLLLQISSWFRSCDLRLYFHYTAPPGSYIINIFSPLNPTC